MRANTKPLRRWGKGMAVTGVGVGKCKDMGQNDAQKREQVLLLTVVVTFCALLPTAYAAYISNSTALRADFLRCAGEFSAIFLSWLVLRQVSRADSATYNYGLGKLEQIASLAVAAALFLSFAIAFISGLSRLCYPEPLHGTTFGLLLSIVSVACNAYVWIKDYNFHQRSPSPVIDAQWKLFRAKTLATVVVSLSLLCSILLSNTIFGLYFDPIGSLLLALFLLYSSYSMVSVSLPDLIDRSVDEKVQLIILSTLILHEAKYVNLERVRSRRVGAHMFVDVFLSFSPNSSFIDVHTCVMAIKGDLKTRLGGAEVIVIPSIPSTCSPQ